MRAVALACIGILSGCGVVAGRPPSIRYGEEACAHCRMIIGDDHFAAAIVGDDGETMKFDDIGCLVDYEAGQRSPAAATYWVRNFAGGDWLDARLATYVHSETVHSPMGYGLTAFPPKSPGTGSGLRFSELPALVAASRRAMRTTAAPDH